MTKYILIVWMISGQELHLPKANEEICLRDMKSVLSGPARAQDAECMPIDMRETIQKLKSQGKKKEGQEI